MFTLGLDMVWRRLAVSMIRPSNVAGTWLDVCSGTGEMVELLAQSAKPATRLVAADFSSDMIHVAKRKSLSRTVLFTLADAGSLPFKDESFDLITISFATRNLTRTRDQLLHTFQEFNRVLKPGGVFLNLETSQPPQTLIRTGFHLYVNIMVNHLGPLLAGSKSGYSFLSNTVRRFHDAKSLAHLLRVSGFQHVSYRRIMFGIAAIHLAIK